MAKNVSNLANYGDSQLVKDAGSLSFFTPLGTKDNVDECAQAGDGAGQYGTGNTGGAVPGVCVVDYMIVPGKSIDGTSGLNIASKKLYTFVRHANSGSRNYDSPDLMNFAFSGVSLFTFIGECSRVYGVINKYSAKNRYLGRMLTRALGFDYDDLTQDLAGYRAMLNVAIAKLNAIKIPAAWPFWGKNWNLNAVVLKDGEIDRSQLYAYRSTVIWKYNESGEYVGSLTPYFVFGTSESTLLTRSTIKSIIDTIVNAFVASEDINIMSGDIVKAYGEDKCMELPFVSEDMMLEPIYNREMLEIMHNTSVVEVSKVYSTTKGMIIVQDSQANILKFNPIVTPGQIMGAWETVEGETRVATVTPKDYLDLFRDDVTPDDVINSSIMTVVVDPVGSNNEYYLYDFGTELAINCHIWSIAKDGSELVINSVRRHIFANPNGDSASIPFGDLVGVYQLVSMLTKFDWHPRVTVYSGNGAKTAYEPFVSALRLYDLYNYTVISEIELTRIHNLHVLGGFGLAD